MPMTEADRQLLELEFESDLVDGFDQMCKTLEKCAEVSRNPGRALEMLAALKKAFGGSVETKEMRRGYIVRKHEAFGLDELRTNLFGIAVLA